MPIPAFLATALALHLFFNRHCCFSHLHVNEVDISPLGKSWLAVCLPPLFVQDVEHEDYLELLQLQKKTICLSCFTSIVQLRHLLEETYRFHCIRARKCWEHYYICMSIWCRFAAAFPWPSHTLLSLHSCVKRSWHLGDALTNWCTAWNNLIISG